MKKDKKLKSGVPGVTRCINADRWRVQLRYNGKVNFHGLFEDLKDAVEVASKVREAYPRKVRDTSKARVPRQQIGRFPALPKVPDSWRV